MVRDSWDENEEKRKFQKQERRTPSETARLTLLNASTWSTEKKYMRRYKGTFHILFGCEHRMKEDEMEEQFNKETNQECSLAADAARVTEDSAGTSAKRIIC